MKIKISINGHDVTLDGHVSGVTTLLMALESKRVEVPAQTLTIPRLPPKAVRRKNTKSPAERRAALVSTLQQIQVGETIAMGEILKRSGIGEESRFLAYECLRANGGFQLNGTGASARYTRV